MSLSEKSPNKALVVFSGGQDSTTCLYWALKNFSHVECITFDYGQRHSIELKCAQKLCEIENLEQRVVPIPTFSFLGPNALTHKDIEIDLTSGMSGLPSTFVPGRNAVFLSFAAGFAASRGITDIVMGICEADFSGYPDCREEFAASMEKSLGLAVGMSLKIHRPLMWLNKKQTFELASNLDCLENVLEFSHTCYEGVRSERHAWGYGCGKCPSCELRKNGYQEFLKEHK